MNKLRLTLLAAAAWIFLPSAGAAFSLGENWTRVDPRAGSQASDLVANGGRLIAVGEGGAIWETSDRQTWTTPRSGVLVNLNAVAAGNGVLVSVGAAGTVLRSEAPGIWTKEVSGVVVDLTSVTYGNGMFVAVGKSGVAAYSSDGRTWLEWPTGQTAPLNRVAWNGTAFLAGGNAGLLLKASPWGQWSVVPLPWGAYDDIRAIAGKGPGWVIGSTRPLSAEVSMHSTDGVTWTHGGGTSFKDMVAGAGKFVGTSTYGALQLSADGVAWSECQTSSTADFIAVEWTGSDFVAMTARRQLAVSVDGKRWTARGLMKDTVAGCWDGSQYAVVGANGMIFTSPEGRTWTSEVNPDTNDLTCVNFANGRFLAVGKEGVILHSLNGRDWQKAVLPVGWDFYDVHWSGSAFWTVGEGGVVLTSSDGLVWHITNPGTIDAVVWDGHRYLAFSGRTVIESQDGNNWNPVTGVPWPGNATPPECKIHQIIWTGQHYVAVGERRWVLRSSDGIQWTRGEIDGYVSTSLEFNSIAWSGSRFVAMAKGGSEFILSDDGLNWTRKTFAGAMTSTTKSVIWDGIRFVAVSGNTVLTSPDGTVWTLIETIMNGGQAVSLESIAWDGTRYLVAGAGAAYGSSGGIIGTSATGVTWTFSPVEPGTSYSRIMADAGSAMALRSDGQVKRWNGSTWVLEHPDLSGELLALTKKGTSYAVFTRSGMVSTSKAPGTWQTGDRRVSGVTLRSIISANGVFVAGSQGYQASILRSTDGRNWTSQTIPGEVGPFINPIWTGSEFLMLGRNRTYVSTDGIGWTASQGAWGMTYASSLASFGGKTVVAGTGIWIEDGSVFRQVQQHMVYPIQALISNGSELLAIGNNETMASSDGENWEIIDPEPRPVASLADVVHTPTGFYACGELSQIQHSLDGKTWSQRTVKGMPKLNAMINTHIGLVGVGIGFAFSPDGQTWTCKSDSNEYTGLAFGNGRIVATALNHAAVSTDGINWQVVTHNLRGGKVVWSGSEFVMALEERGMAVSSDGLSWKAVVIPGTITGCAASQDVYIACNSHGNIYRSTDGANWSMMLDSSDTAGKMRVVWCGSLFFIFGDYIHSSTDGDSWTQRTRNHNDIVWTGARYVGVGNSGVVSVSTNGTAWSNAASGTTSRLNRVIWTGSGLMAVGVNGTLITSPDGLTWSAGNSGTSKELVDVVVHNGKWIAVASDGSVVYETGGAAVPEGFLANCLLVDGSTVIAAGRAGRMAKLEGNEWHEVPTPTSGDLRAICTTPAGLQACGSENVILRRTQGGQWSGMSGGMSGGTPGVLYEIYIDLWVSGGELKVLGSRGLVASSSTGRLWYPQQRINIASAPRDTVELSGKLFAVGDAGSIVIVKGGTSTSASSPTTLGLRAVAAGHNRLVAVGRDGVILVSEAEPWSSQADTDKDGLSDFLEWATGSDPETSSSSQLMFSRENDRLVFAYPRSLEAVEDGTVFTVEWSDDLLVWQSQGVLEIKVTSVDSNVQRITVEVPAGATGSRFVRLRVSDPP